MNNNNYKKNQYRSNYLYICWRSF